nr:uncharacterized protein LOC112289022 isoform X3 [Physcomitrium patens]|eukprot:XP_024389670.1 uncharacterized protein LOC112289022 isoform X3 [Physcomitrella patens]
MARAAGSNTKFASVNLNKSYGKSTTGAGGSGNGSGAGSGALGSAGRAARNSSHGGMLLLSRPGVATSVQKGKVIVPRPVNLPSLRREHAGNDPTIALVGGSGASGWTKASLHEDQSPAAAAATSETSTGIARIGPALSVASTWGTSPSLSGQPSSVSLSGEHWVAPTQAEASGTNSSVAGRHGVYTPPRARAMLSPTVASGHVVPAVEKAVVLRGEDFPTLQAALPPLPIPSQQKQKDLHQKQREKQQELKAQQHKLQLLSEQHPVLKPGEVSQFPAGGPQLHPIQSSSVQMKSEQSLKDAAEEHQLLEQVCFIDSGTSARSTSKAGSSSLEPATSGPSQPRQSNWTDDERDSNFSVQCGNSFELSDRSDRESDLQSANRAGEVFGYGRSRSSREMASTPGIDGHIGKVAEGRGNMVGGDNLFGRESSSTGHHADNSFYRGKNIVREGGFREREGGVNRELGFGGRGFSREGNRDVGSSKRSAYEKDGGDGRPSSRGWDGFDERHGFGNRDQGLLRDASLGRVGGLNREIFFGRDSRRIQSGDSDASRGRFGGDRFPRNGASGDFINGRGFIGQDSAERDKRSHEGHRFNVSYERSFEEIHGLDNFRPSQGVGIDPPVIPMLGFRKKKEEVKEIDFRDEEREAFEAELERVQKAQELDRLRKLEEKEHAVEMAQKELEDRERQAREEEERQAKMEEEAREASARAEREALEVAQKVEDERRAWDEEKRQLQLEEERRKENARRKLLELEERIAKREAEKKLQEESRQIVEEKPVHVWQRGEEDLRRREDDEREVEERMVVNNTGNSQDDDDRAALRPSVTLSYSQVSQRAFQNENLPVKPSEVQAPPAGLISRVAESRGNNSVTENERKTFMHWRKEQSSDSVVGSAVQMFSPYGRNENTDFQASISRDRACNGRDYGDRGENSYTGAPSTAGLATEGSSGESVRRPHSNDEGRQTEEPVFFSKQTYYNRASTSGFESGPLEDFEARDERRWGRDRMDRWRRGREGVGQRPSPPQTPPYFQGSDPTEPSSYCRLRHSLSRQPRVPPPPVRMGAVRPAPRFSSLQIVVASSEAEEEDIKDVLTQQERAVGSSSKFSSQDVNDDQHAKISSVKNSDLELRQKDAPEQQSKPWSSTQRDWEQFSTSSLGLQCSLSQVSPGHSHEDSNVQLFSPSPGRNDNNRNGGSSCSSQSQSDGDYEQRDSGASFVVSKVGQQEMLVTPDGLSGDREDYTISTDDGEGEDENQERYEEGYEAFEGYDEDEDVDNVDDEDEDDELDHGTGRADVLEATENRQHNEQNIDDAITEQDAAEELANSTQLQVMTEEMRNRHLPHEENGQINLRPSVAGLVEESDSCDAQQASVQQLQLPLSFMAFPTSQKTVAPSSSSQPASVGVPGLIHSSEVSMTLHFGFLPGTALPQGSVPAIQIGSIQTPLHVPLHSTLHQVPHSSSAPPLIQFGQLAHSSSVLQSTPAFSQSNESTQVQEQISQAVSTSKVLQEEDIVDLISAADQGQPRKDSVSLQLQSPWMNQSVSLDVKPPVEVETRENRLTTGKPGQRSERRVRDRGVIHEGSSSTAGPESYSRLKSSRRDAGKFPFSGSSFPQSTYETAGIFTGTIASNGSSDGAALRPRSYRRSNFRRTDLKSSDFAEQLSDVAGGKFSKQITNTSFEILDMPIGTTDGRLSSRDVTSQLQGSNYSGDNSRKSRVLSEGASSSRSERPGIERGDEDDFIEVRSKRQMLSDRRAEREKEIKSKSNLKAKEHAARKQRGVAKLETQMEAASGQGTKSGSFVEKRTIAENTGTTTRIPHSGTTPSPTVASLTTVAGNSQGLPLAPIGTPSGGLPDIRPNLSKSSRSNSGSGGSLIDCETGAATASCDNQNQHQEGMSGTPIAWGGTQSTRQVVSLTQIQLEEAMKPARYGAPVAQKLPVDARGSMVLDSGTTVASMAAKEKISGFVTGPVGSLLAGDKIQFVTSPPLGVSNSRPHTPALISAVGSTLGSHVNGASEKSDLKKSNHMSSSEHDMPSFSIEVKRTRGHEDNAGNTDGVIDAEAEAEAEAAASAVAVAAISSDESFCSTREPIAIRKSTIIRSFGSGASTTNHAGMGLGNSIPVRMQSPIVEDSMAAALPADLSVEPTSISIRGSSGQGSSVLSTSVQTSFSGLEMSKMLGFPFGPSKDAAVLPGSNDQGVPSASASASGWQLQHSGVDSFYGGGPPSGFPGQYINPGAGMPPHMLVYSNPFSSVGQFGQLGFMGPTYLPSGKQPDWKHTPVWSSSPGVVSMNSNDSLGGIAGTQRGSGNTQRMAPGPAVVPVVQSPGPFDLNLSAPFQIPNVDSSTGWSHVPGQMHVPISMGYLQQGRRGSSNSLEKDESFNLGRSSNQVNDGNFTSMDAAAQFPDELGLGDTSSVPSITSAYGSSQNLGRSFICNQAAPISSSDQSNNKLRSNRRSSRVTRGGNLTTMRNGNNIGSDDFGMGVNSGAYNNAGANGSRAPHNHLQPQSPRHLYQAMGGVGQYHAHHINSHSDQRGSSQQNSPRVGSSNWLGPHRKWVGNQARPPVERGSSGEKIFAPPAKLKQVYVAKPTSSPRRISGETAIFNDTEGGQATVRSTSDHDLLS